MMSETRFKQLIEKHLAHDLLPEERKDLANLVAHSNERDLENALEKVWNGYHLASGRNNEAYERVTAHVQSLLKERPRGRVVRMSGLWKIASVVVLMLGLMGVTHYFTRQHTYHQIASNEINIATRQGERIALTLPDGTKVSLNARSSFTYPASFGLRQRQVSLSGEAYFEVTHNEKQPFIVETPQVHIRVLGTTFNVNAYPENDFVETLLVEGKVELYASNDRSNTLTLLPNQTGRYNVTTQKFARNKTDRSMTLGWINGDLIFRSNSLTEVFAEIEKYYGVTIQTQGTLPSDQFVGVFHHEEINDVLKNLQVHYDFAYTKRGNELTIKFNR